MNKQKSNGCTLIVDRNGNERVSTDQILIRPKFVEQQLPFLLS